MSEEVQAEQRRLPLFAMICAIYIVAFGLMGVLSGGWPVAAGTPLLYLVTGASFMISGGLLLARRKAGLHLYGLTLLALIVWHVAVTRTAREALPRLILPIAVGAYLGTPSVRASLNQSGTSAMRRQS